MHDPDVWALAVAHGRRELLVVVGPGDSGHADLDVGMFGVELLHHLLHDRPVTTGETVPVGKFDRGAVVTRGTASARCRLLLTRRARRTWRAGPEADSGRYP